MESIIYSRSRDGRRNLFDLAAAEADERYCVISGSGDSNGSDVIIARPRDGGDAGNGVGAFDGMINIMFTAVVVADLQRLKPHKIDETVV